MKRLIVGALAHYYLWVEKRNEARVERAQRDEFQNEIAALERFANSSWPLRGGRG